MTKVFKTLALEKLSNFIFPNLSSNIEFLAIVSMVHHTHLFE